VKHLKFLKHYNINLLIGQSEQKKKKKKKKKKRFWPVGVVRSLLEFVFFFLVLKINKKN
jgi:quinol-cytochrome oxidoreductase complex cytochrome b subunit